MLQPIMLLWGLLKVHLNMKKFLVAKGIYLHQRCCAHIINLIVQEGLKVIDESVEKVRETAKYVKWSQVRKQKFVECVNYASLNLKRGLRQDVPTRWNSTFLMLDSDCYFRSALLHKLSDSNYTSCPSKDEWGKLEKIKKFLATFYEVTRIFFGVRYPTANLYFPSVFKVYGVLRYVVSGDDDYLKVMSAKMVGKFKKYWSEFSIILCIAVILDPRYKLQLVVWSYVKMYGSNSSEFERVRNALFSFFDEYKVWYEQLSSSSKTGTSTSLDDQNLDIVVNDDVLEGFDYFDENEHELTSKKTELESYLEEKRMDRRKELNVIEHWRNDELRYPVLARMTRDVLSIPISTLVSESAFSGGGRVLDQYRSTLRSKVVEVLMCCKDWLYGDKDSRTISMDEIAQDVIQANQSQEEERGGDIPTMASETVKVL